MKNNRSLLNGKSQPALLFIPDISGYTRFVSGTEISHARHIIEELLEAIIDANTIGMEVSEIEGDAILFYRFGTAPTAAELLAQIQRMFINFHTHLKKYETHRICNCGACRSTDKLTLKFVAHYGDITINTIKKHQSLFGKEVIVAHRLLKNHIEHHEYAMITHNLVRACATWIDVDTAAWAPVHRSEEEYDSGKVSFCYLPLVPLMEHIPELTAEDYSIPGVKVSMLKCERMVNAPLELVFNVVADLPWRSKWIAGSLPEVDQLNHHIIQTGATHHCLANGPVIVSHDFETSEDLITFTETDTKRTLCAVYTLRKSSSGQTLMEAEWFLKRNLLMQLMFRLFMKKKLRREVLQSYDNLNNYCRSLIEQHKDHPYMIVLESEQKMAV